ncbi:unnamed protein product [Cylicocyclus nassatus]|uniref:Uncharacterized protein n=1 Tax=Cylicocyclus nassatus TaxID=53992 RepID=A0AA36HH08_CYLNA|nr:unnamed protein product [Cylicocyclus nassatus]
MIFEGENPGSASAKEVLHSRGLLIAQRALVRRDGTALTLRRPGARKGSHVHDNTRDATAPQSIDVHVNGNVLAARCFGLPVRSNESKPGTHLRNIHWVCKNKRGRMFTDIKEEDEENTGITLKEMEPTVPFDHTTFPGTFITVIGPHGNDARALLYEDPHTGLSFRFILHRKNARKADIYVCAKCKSRRKYVRIMVHESTFLEDPAALDHVCHLPMEEERKPEKRKLDDLEKLLPKRPNLQIPADEPSCSAEANDVGLELGLNVLKPVEDEPQQSEQEPSSETKSTSLFREEVFLESIRMAVEGLPKINRDKAYVDILRYIYTTVFDKYGNSSTNA